MLDLSSNSGGSVKLVIDQQREDQAFVNATRAGDMEGFAGIYTKYCDNIRGWLINLSGDPHLAEDLTQDTFVRALGNIGSVQVTHRSGLSPWLYTIARNLLFDHSKAASTRITEPTDEIPDFAHPRTIFEDKTIGYQDRMEILSVVAEEVPADFRDALFALDYYDMTDGDAATLLDTKPATVRSRASRGRAAARAALEEHTELDLSAYV